MSEKMKRMKRELKYEGSIVKVYMDEVELPNGKIAKWDFINHDGAAAVVPVTSEGKILMVKQYRNALDRNTLEIPAGKLDDISEETSVCAARELEEETGYKPGKLEFLMTLCTWVAFTNEKIDVYVATDLIPAKQNLDEDEFIDVKVYSVDDLKEKIFKGELQDTKTISAILAYDTKYRK